MDFEYSDEQKLLSETLRKFLNTAYNFDARAKILAGPSGFSDDVWASLAEMGILGVPFDPEHGGFGGTSVDMMVVMEALGILIIRRIVNVFTTAPVSSVSAKRPSNCARTSICRRLSPLALWMVNGGDGGGVDD